jgi:uncharacterized protein YdcH (DUF465 family)
MQIHHPASQLPDTPYIFLTPKVSALVPYTFEEKLGVQYNRTLGVHAIWAARVPFLPAMISEDFRRLGKDRIGLIMRRQFRFLYDLARARDLETTFELRFIVTPNPIKGLPSLIEIIFFGKVFSSEESKAQEAAERLWQKFMSNYPLEDPFNYPIEPVIHKDVFQKYYEPILLNEVERENIIEIRKFEDMPLQINGQFFSVEKVGDYIVYPLVPSIDFSAMGRFLTALANQNEHCFVAVSLRPTRLFPEEIHNLSALVAYFQSILIDEDRAINTIRREEYSSQHSINLKINEYRRGRAELGAKIYRQLVQEREQLVSIRITLVGEYEAPLHLAEAFGSEIMGNVDNRYPTSWEIIRPADGRELAIACDNLRYFGQDHWGYTLIDGSPGLYPHRRLRYLATAQEAFGAFRLPIPPDSGYIPGILVKTSNTNCLNQGTEKTINVGSVYHRGNPTPQTFEIPVRDLTRHALIAGSTGSGKTNTVKHLLAQLWGQHCIPFLVLYPIDKPDYRELRAYKSLSQDLFVFTLGDESTSPFRFNPFEVPDGLLLKTYISRLMRVFESAFSLHDPLPMIFREALRRAYKSKGWNISLDRGDTKREYPIMSEFHQAIKEVTELLSYGKDLQHTIQQASIIRIGDLLENAGSVLNVRQSMDFQVILNQPVVMELGRVGSPQDTALLMGFLLMRFAAELERHPRKADNPHITVVEEAHRLMSAGGKTGEGSNNSLGAAGEDFSNILAEVRGFGEGLLIAEQIPTLLVKGAIGNTYLKIMHWLEDPESFNLFSQVMNLDPEQQEYTRTLTPGFAIIRSPYGQPVHLKVPDVRNNPDYDGDSVKLDDLEIRAFMAEQREKHHLGEQTIIAWEDGIQSQRNKSLDVSRLRLSERFAAAPMKTCAFCEEWLDQGNCLYRKEYKKLPSDEILGLEQIIASNNDNEAHQQDIVKMFMNQSNYSKGLQYCTLAHLVEPYTDKQQNGTDPTIRKQYRKLLKIFAELKYKMNR